LVPLPIVVPSIGGGSTITAPPFAPNLVSAPLSSLAPGVPNPPPLPAPKKVAGSHVRRDALIFGLAFLLLVGLGGGAYFYFAASPEPVEAPVASRPKPAAPPAPAQTPSAPPVTAETVKTAASVAAAPSPAQPAPVNEASSPASPPPPPPPPQPSARFTRYADGLRVSGVFQGSPARALVDGRIVREGDVIETNLGIRFVAVDLASKHLVLQDASGAMVRVKYPR
jgi:hypothetical protein